MKTFDREIFFSDAYNLFSAPNFASVSNGHFCVNKHMTAPKLSTCYVQPHRQSKTHTNTYIQSYRLSLQKNTT